jgi:hypothetical protein
MDGKREKFMYLVTQYIIIKTLKKKQKLLLISHGKKKKLGIYLCRKRERKGHFIQGRFGFKGTL